MKSSTQNPIIFIVGPTSSGKSSVAMEAAQKLDGEIIAADSQTIKRGLNIGTAKPSLQDMNAVKHHLVDIIDPFDSFSAYDFKNLASKAVQDIRSRSKTPIVVGGSGLYIDSLYFDYTFVNNNSTDKLENKSVGELKSIITSNQYSMPENSQNIRHLLSAIRRGKKSAQDRVPIKGALMFGIRRTDEELKHRINLRIEHIFNRKLIEEAKGIVDKYGDPPKKIDAIAYPILRRYINGRLSSEQTKEELKRAEWRYARVQKAWFKRNPNIYWISNYKLAAKTIIKEVKHY